MWAARRLDGHRISSQCVVNTLPHTAASVCAHGRSTCHLIDSDWRLQDVNEWLKHTRTQKGQKSYFCGSQGESAQKPFNKQLKMTELLSLALFIYTVVFYSHYKFSWKYFSWFMNLIDWFFSPQTNWIIKLFSWLNKQTDRKEQHSFMLADPATFF